MVLYKVEENYFKDILKGMNNRRDSLYDVTLKVGDEKLHSHKAVLVTGSDYFNSLFVGPFAEKDKSEIDLTDLTDRVDLMENVVTFLYFGEIEINEINIESLMKVSSFLLIPKLQGFCTEFIVENLGLRSCLKYYFGALHYGFPDLERKIGNILQSRFHDYIIFHEEAVALSPNELSHLLKKDFLKFCRASDLLDFLLNWIKAVTNKNRKLADEHLDFVCQFMDYVACKDLDRLERKDCEKQFGELKKVLDELNDNIESDLAKTFHKQIEQELKCFEKKSEMTSRKGRKAKTACLKKLKSCGEENSFKHQKEPTDLEDTVIVVSPRKYLLDRRDPVKNMRYLVLQYNPISKAYEEPVFDVLGYVPKRKVWYYVNFMHDRSIMSDLLRDSGDSGFTQVGDKIFHLHEEDSDPISFRLEDSSSTRTWYNDYHYHGENDPQVFKHCVKSGLVVVNGSVYVVHLISVCPSDSDDDADYDYHLCCCKLMPDNTWEIVFKTETFKYDHPNDARIFVSFTEISNEMIIVFYCNNLISCYIVDVFARGGPKLLRVFPAEGRELPAPDKEKKWWEAKIIEGKDRFHILEVEYAYKEEPSGKFEQRAVFGSHEYVFGSHVLTPANIEKIDLDYKVCDFKKKKGFFFGSEYIAPDRKSVWVFDGNEKDVSSLQEVVIEDGQLKVCSHIPPPTCYVNAVFAVKLSPTYLAGKRIIKKYMLAEDQPTD